MRRTPRTLGRVLGIVAMAAIFCTATAHAATWSDGNSTWNTPGNWDANDVPDSAGESAVIGNGSTVSLDLTATINNLTVGAGNVVNWSGGAAWGLTVGGDLSNDGEINVLQHGQNGQRSELIYTGTTLSNSSSTINMIVNNSANNRNVGGSFEANNTNAGTINIEGLDGTNERSGARLTLTGAGTFENAGTIAILNSGTSTVVGARGNRAGLQGVEAGYNQTGASALTSVMQGGGSEMAFVDVGTLLISAGTLSGNGLIVEQGDDNTAQIGDGSGDEAYLVPGTDGTIDTIHFGTAADVIYYSSPDRLDLIRGTGPTASDTSLSLGADSTFMADINTSTAASDLASVLGDLDISAGAVLALSDLGGDALLPVGTVLTLIDYRDTWNGGTWDGLADGSQFALGSNSYEIDYDGGDGTDVVLTVLPPPIPEPVTLLSLGLGMAGVGVRLRRRS